VISPSEERLQRLWVKAMAATDPSEIESLLMEFRDALHEHMQQMKAEAKQEGLDRKLSAGSQSKPLEPLTP
jgi:hypothetical protein